MLQDSQSLASHCLTSYLADKLTGIQNWGPESFTSASHGDSGWNGPQVSNGVLDVQVTGR
jgi:hypothetical protein